MTIIKLRLDELTPDPENAKAHPAKQIEQIKESIRKFKNCDPIAVWGEDNLIVEGHGRYEALKQLGYEEAEVIRLDHLTAEERRAYALTHNQLTMNTSWIPELLESDLDQIQGIDMRVFGFDGLNEWFDTGDTGEAMEGEDEYQEFLDKFEAKHTTDDCYTPEKVYKAVADWVASEYGLSQKDFVRPFYPGGDYQKEKYKPRSVVVDNPPFSILAQIIKWYTEHDVKFFLFAPALTVFSSAAALASVLCTGVSIVYANGATVATSFVTNLEDGEIRAKTAPALYETVNKAVDEVLAETRKVIPVYSYPDYVATAAMLNKYSKYGIEYTITKAESAPIDALDAQKEAGKAIFGKGLLLAERAAAERAAAERAAAERAAATRWEISPRERELIQSLG
jgi:hypothetical protein